MTALIGAPAHCPTPARYSRQTSWAIIVEEAGPAGYSAAALALANSKLNIVLLESGGMDFDPKIQNMYAGDETGVRYTALDSGRLRFMGGSSNHWGGFCRPLDEIDFEPRDWLAHSGWPFSRAEIEPYFRRAQALCEAGPWIYDKGAKAVSAPLMDLGPGGLYTSWFQFSKTRDSVLPTYFGHRYQQDLRAASNVTPYTHANVTGIRLTPNAQAVERLDMATLNAAGVLEKRFTVKPRMVVLAAGAMENARLLLASSDVMPGGIGNQNDLVGRFFADHPIPREVATLVVFGGALPACYGTTVTLDNGGDHRGRRSRPRPSFCCGEQCLGSRSAPRWTMRSIWTTPAKRRWSPPRWRWAWMPPAPGPLPLGCSTPELGARSRSQQRCA